jgi:MoxR-like ATPase
MTYPFNLLGQSDPQMVLAALQNRPLSKNGLADDACRFVPDEDLQIAINTAIAVGEPLLLTGQPGTGKTQAAYYVAWKLGLEQVLHFQVKSDSTAQDLLYHFDSVRYFHDAHLLAGATLSKANYVEPRPLWEALVSDTPRVLLIDEIDKAPRDFPNDLLHELDQMHFTVKETGEKVEVKGNNRPLVFITSNSERRLPEAFLRRCVFHHIDFNSEMLMTVLGQHKAAFSRFSDDFLKLAIARFMELHKAHGLRKPPATGELLVWLRTMALDAGVSPQRMAELFAQLSNRQQLPPYIGTLLKDRDDTKATQQRYPA